MLPVVGIVPDLINVAFTASRGKWGTAGFNLVAAIPGIGDALKGGKMLAVAGTTGTGIIAIVIKKNGDKPLETAAKLADDAVKQADNVVKQADNAAGLVDDAVKEVEQLVAPIKGLPASTAESVTDKLRRYLLDLNHPVGGDKATWFQKALGFTQDNLDELAEQIKFDPAKAVATELTQHGQKYEQITEIVGANGKRIPTLFVWIKNKDGIVRLVTSTLGVD